LGLIHWVPGALSLVVKRPGHEPDRSTPSSAEVKTETLQTCPRIFYTSSALSAGKYPRGNELLGGMIKVIKLIYAHCLFRSGSTTLGLKEIYYEDFKRLRLVSVSRTAY
jgi:hypothetical protein